MRVEFKGVVVDGISGGFTLMVGNETVTFTPVSEHATASNTNTTYFYRLQFDPHTMWGNVCSGGKIPAIKVVRARLTNCGLGEAKAIVEGEGVYIEGPMWDKSELRRDLESTARGTFRVTPCANAYASSPYKFT